MKIRALAIAALLVLAPAAWSQEQAFTNRSTDLRERGANDARALTTLPENTSVKVLARAGGWTRQFTSRCRSPFECGSRIVC